MKKDYFSPELDLVQLKLESVMSGEQYIRPSLREDDQDDEIEI